MGRAHRPVAVDERYFTIYFAKFPIACFDSRKLLVSPLPKREHFDVDEAGEGELWSAPHPQTQPDPKLSGMCPV